VSLLQIEGRRSRLQRLALFTKAGRKSGKITLKETFRELHETPALCKDCFEKSQVHGIVVLS